ncbi:alkaline shock response membrane anchor protein AmaP [Streptomyces chumphonensis]|uniref:Alkaline shock response membrane anchor protein AmaP n=1 Tax=Streptomyces chumphonensis TaxID=1214925 RepID=A0A927IBA7_9ACTN|nr:alkaline shock response membrane anchor protein AmaP [Streptomyces chumphonensis]MBD3930016.1 alkaline shock response membrane anchor protein AmaP [Streptomyces chumphonensis]
MLRTVNRVLLALTGLALLGLGAAGLAGGTDLFRRLDVTPPDGYSWRNPDEVLLTREDRTQWTDESWWWPVVLSVLGVLLVVALWWLIAQLRSRRVAAVLVDSGDGAGAAVRGSALADVIAAETEELPGVRGARTRLVGRRRAPRARVGVLVGADARPAGLVRALHRGPLEHARASAGLESLPAEARLRGARGRPERLT